MDILRCVGKHETISEVRIGQVTHRWGHGIAVQEESEHVPLSLSKSFIYQLPSQSWHCQVERHQATISTHERR